MPFVHADPLPTRKLVLAPPHDSPHLPPLSLKRPSWARAPCRPVRRGRSCQCRPPCSGRVACPAPTTQLARPISVCLATALSAAAHARTALAPRAPAPPVPTARAATRYANGAHCTWLFTTQGHNDIIKWVKQGHWCSLARTRKHRCEVYSQTATKSVRRFRSHALAAQALTGTATLCAMSWRCRHTWSLENIFSVSDTTAKLLRKSGVTAPISNWSHLWLLPRSRYVLSTLSGRWCRRTSVLVLLIRRIVLMSSSLFYAKIILFFIRQFGRAHLTHKQLRSIQIDTQVIKYWILRKWVCTIRIGACRLLL